MNIIVNGDRTEVSDGTTVAALVTTLATAPEGIAVALNDAVVPRGAWATTTVREADRLEVLTAVQGG